ncbi:hypothetical protein [Bradyrhizobium sp.]|uniref:hypothetical protein n=1 Tax=Bradyrhizobium sp. TaxID=376 RepID=UPI003BAE226F
MKKYQKMRGGRRAGSGRKKNSPNKASAKREREAAASGATPRDVMLMSMRSLWALADENKKDKKAFEHYIRAAAVAKDAAPYFHPRLSTVDQAQGAGGTTIRVHVTGGLPVGSTPERPEGTEYSEVPPEEPYR